MAKTVYNNRKRLRRGANVGYRKKKQTLQAALNSKDTLNDIEKWLNSQLTSVILVLLVQLIH